jgi:HPt (histidine-containing phosphotransfer) domain-containing protein
MVLDEKYLANVANLVGREALQALAGSFQTELRQRLAAITAPEAECETIEQEAHALVSLAGNLGLVELSACSRQLTDTCRSAEGDIPKRVRDLNEAAQRALARLEIAA